MRELSLIRMCLCWFACGTTLFAQGFAVHANGYGGTGFEYSNVSSGGFSAASSDLITDLGVTADGYLYHPLLMDYTIMTNWDRSNNSVDQGGSHSNGLLFNTGFDFLPVSSIPFTISFSRGSNTSSGSLVPPLTLLNTNFGLHGQFRNHPRLFHLNYSFGTSKSESAALGTPERFKTKSRFADVNLERQWLGWNLRLNENYTHSDTNFTNLTNSFNTLSFDASHQIGNRIRIDLNAFYSQFNLQSLSANLTSLNSRNSAQLLTGRMSWKMSKKLDSNYSISADRNAVNTARILSLETNTATPLSTAPLAIQAQSESASAGLVYRPTDNLSLNANSSYSHNGIPTEQLSLQSAALITTDVVVVGTGYSYRHPIWKMEYQNGGTVTRQQFGFLAGSTESGLGYSQDNRLSGGDVRKARLSASYRYSQQLNPLFFQVSKQINNFVGFSLDSNYFGFVALSASAEASRGNVSLADSHLNTSSSNLSLSAAFPRKQLTIYASHTASNSNDLLFGANSILFQPGGSTGGVILPFVNNTMFDQTRLDRVGVTWRPSPNLSIEGRVLRTDILLNSQSVTASRYLSGEALAEYKFGRFTLSGGYGRVASDANSSNAGTSKAETSRVVFRIRFPFHLL